MFPNTITIAKSACNIYKTRESKQYIADCSVTFQMGQKDAMQHTEVCMFCSVGIHVTKRPDFYRDLMLVVVRRVEN